MGKLTLKAIGVLLKKIAYIAKKYTDFKISANSVHLYEKATANTGYLKTYILSTALTLAAVTSANTIGEIDIPKDFLTKDAKKIEVVAGEAGSEWEGKLVVVKVNGAALSAQDYYEAPAEVTSAGLWADFIINTKGNDESETPAHLCFDLTELINIYNAGNGLILNNGTFSIKINALNAHGLSVGANGLEMALAQAPVYTLVGGENTVAVADTDYYSLAGGMFSKVNDIVVGTTDVSAYYTLTTPASDGAISAEYKGKLDKNLEDCNMALLSDAELASWFGYDITGTPASGSEAETIKTGLANLSTDSITDEPGA